MIPQQIRSLFLATTLVAFIEAASGATLVYEGFNYGGSDQDIAGVTASGIGLAGTYGTVNNDEANGSSTQTSIYTSNGLSFGGLSTSGGALIQSVNATTDLTKEYVYTTIPLNITIGAGTTVYQSMLINMTSNTFSAGYGESKFRVVDTSHPIGNDHGGLTTSLGNDVDHGINASVAYDENDPSDAPVSISAAVTYLSISKYTNVGAPGGGQATMWLLTEAQFADWMQNSGEEAGLNSTSGVLKTGFAWATNERDIDLTKSLRFSTGEATVDFNGPGSLYSNTGEITTVFDEIRYGTSLGDVIVAVPEPSTYALIVSSLIIGAATYRHRRR